MNEISVWKRQVERRFVDEPRLLEARVTSSDAGSGDEAEGVGCRSNLIQQHVSIRLRLVVGQIPPRGDEDVAGVASCVALVAAEIDFAESCCEDLCRSG